MIDLLKVSNPSPSWDWIHSFLSPHERKFLKQLGNQMREIEDLRKTVNNIIEGANIILKHESQWKEVWK